MTVPNTDYDAAQALLDLQGTMKQESPGSYLWQGCDNSEDLEKTAKLFWNCFIASDVPVLTTLHRQETIAKSQEKSCTNYDNVCEIEEYSNRKPKNRLVPKTNVPISNYYRNIESKSSKVVEAPTIMLPSHKLLETDKCNNTEYDARKTREVATQTEERYFNPNIEFMETTIKNLCERIQSLEAQLKPPHQNSGYASSENEDIDGQSYVSQQSIDDSMKMNVDTLNEDTIYKNYSKRQRLDDSGEINHINRHNRSSAVYNKVITNHNYNANTNDLVPIGDGHATVPARLLKHINWNSYTSATRKLLTAVFSRRILATHSLTGKPSPAFPNKPAKKKLDPALVNDIVLTVAERCSVPENVVRTSITTKCADESKMFKTRQNNKKKRLSKKNCENISPTSESESEDY